MFEMKMDGMSASNSRTFSVGYFNVGLNAFGKIFSYRLVIRQKSALEHDRIVTPSDR